VSEAVTIIAVSTTAVLGVGNLVASSLNSSRERRWGSREERATELRAVLEGAGERLTTFMMAIDEAHDEAKHGRMSEERERELMAIRKELALVGNKIGVRRGASAREYRAFEDFWNELDSVITILDEATTTGLVSEQGHAYTKAWKKMLAAENDYLDATAEALQVKGPVPRWRRWLGKGRKG
jgi:hypothetical protein